MVLKYKTKLKSESYLESMEIASDGYKHKNKLKHYKNN